MKRALTGPDKVAAQNLKRIWNSTKTDLNLTQEKIAAILGWSQPPLNQYLNGIIPLNPTATFKLARALQVEAEDIDPRLSTLVPVSSRLRNVEIMNTGEKLKTHAAPHAYGLRIQENIDRLLPGDVVIANPQATPQENQLCVAWNEGEFTIQRFHDKIEGDIHPIESIIPC